MSDRLLDIAKLAWPDPDRPPLRCWHPLCSAPGEIMVQTETHEYPLCAEHYEECIVSAQKHNPTMDPESVRSAMERASYPVIQ